MDINAESRFAINQTNLDIPRSKFDRSFRHRTTMNTGELIIIYADEAYPGDTVEITITSIIRSQTPIHPVMDNAYIDIYFFSIPRRLVWPHWKEFNGENTTSAWEQTTEYEIPQITAPAGGWQKGTLADYLGITTGVSGISIDACYGRSYALTVNEWFRDQNLQDPAYITLDETTTAGSNGNNYITDLQKLGKPFNVAKFHDYFTSALPEPQKGPSVLLPLGETAPVRNSTDLNNKFSPSWYEQNNTNATGYKRLNANNKNTNGGPTDNGYGQPLYVSLETDLSAATASTVNELRQAFAIQRLYEKDARGGTRYVEIIKSHFGVTSPDARMQRPEYIGGKRIPINMDQVLQTSASETGKTPQGNTAAFSLTADQSDMVRKSFTEHEIVLGLACIRTEHTYQQGINKIFSRRKRFDFYWAALANIGEQAILNKEIYAQGNAQDEEAFGYQEAWAELRYKPNINSGDFRTDLASWHYGDIYSSLPILGPDWIKETPVNTDRTLAVTSSVANQYFADFAFKNYWTRPMPVASIPGLIDHH